MKELDSLFYFYSSKKLIILHIIDYTYLILLNNIFMILFFQKNT